MAAELPSRTDTGTCPVCGAGFQARGRRQHCSDACRQKAWRRRHLATAPPPTQGRQTAGHGL